MRDFVSRGDGETFASVVIDGRGIVQEKPVHEGDRSGSRGSDVPDLNDLDARGINLTFFHCFPHYFVLPMYSSASAYRFRPLGPEETLMEIWSLARYSEGHDPETPAQPEVWEADDPRWPAIPAQDFSNLPRQQKGLHAK